MVVFQTLEEKKVDPQKKIEADAQVKEPASKYLVVPKK